MALVVFCDQFCRLSDVAMIGVHDSVESLDARMYETVCEAHFFVNIVVDCRY